MQFRAKLCWLMVFSLFMTGAVGEHRVMAEDSKENGSQASDNVLDFKMNSLDGKQVDLNQYKGNVVLVVNVASECGLTPQYTQLQALHEKYGVLWCKTTLARHAASGHALVAPSHPARGCPGRGAARSCALPCVLVHAVRGEAAPTRCRGELVAMARACVCVACARARGRSREPDVAHHAPRW